MTFEDIKPGDAVRIQGGMGEITVIATKPVYNGHMWPVAWETEQGNVIDKNNFVRIP